MFNLGIYEPRNVDQDYGGSIIQWKFNILNVPTQARSVFQLSKLGRSLECAEEDNLWANKLWRSRQFNLL